MAVSTLFLLACVADPADPYSPRPGTSDSSVDDSGFEAPPSDLDGDGWSADDGDCDDEDGARYPGAYDRPDDGIDGDCDGVDRACDCLVLDGGASAVAGYSGFGVAASRTLDLAYLLETGISATSTTQAASDSFADVIAALDAEFESTTIGIATFDDYAYGSYGSDELGDKPFELRQQQTDEIDSLRDVLDNIPQHGGEDSPQAAMEGLYQALGGAGYDQDCDATYDSSGDVKPFVADAADPFAGTAGQFFDITDDSTGAVGGMGFRADSALRVIVYSTDGWLRDPENGYGAPGGCMLDAGFSEVVTAALDSGVWLVAIATTELPIPQMEDVADATGAKADTDADGSADDLLVYEIEPTTETFRDSVVGALDAIRVESGLFDVYGSVTLEVRDDPLGIVSSVSPASFDDVAWADVDSLEFDVGYDTSAYGASPVVGYVDFALVGDGFDLQTFRVDVEIAPL